MSRTSTRRTTSLDAERRQFAADVEYYLSQQPPQLPSRYLYDALGSALFDAICRLPWYPITRAEHRLLDDHGGEIFSAIRHLDSIVELGGGNGEKMLTLLEAADDGPEGLSGPEGPPYGVREGRLAGVTIHLVDVSAAALTLSARVLSVLDDVHIVTHKASYEDGLIEVASERPPGDRGTLVLFLGSNIGNFDPPAAAAFLTGVRAALRPGDGFLLGADLVKPEADLLLAYDDPLGVTAAFNRNLLVRINRELEADFDVDAFAHRAVWNAPASRVEMHLVTRTRQRARIEAADLDVEFEAGDTIWTESSYKYTPPQLVALLERAGFTPAEQWVDRDAAFALTLARAR